MESVIDKLRQEGIKAGILRLRTYRPFPVTEIAESVKNAKIIGVIDRDTAFGSPTGGAISSDVRASLQNDPLTRNLRVVPFINGLGGRDVTQQQQMEQIKLVIEAYEKGELPKTDELMGSTYWTGSTGG
jgi:pyruvate ferredoxin oxidoreductase alpha subunit